MSGGNLLLCKEIKDYPGIVAVGGGLDKPLSLTSGTCWLLEM